MHYKKIRTAFLIVVTMLTMNASATNVETDREWYLAGEAMIVSIAADDAMIAYAELCDTRGLAAGIAVSLKEGKGTGIIELPSDLHSGYYLLSAYTRGSSRATWRLVAVVNPLRKSIDDDIQWVSTPDSSRVEPGGPATIPPDWKERQATFKTWVPETEGHIVKARIRNVYDGQTFTASQILPSMSVIGKQIHYFEGKMEDDSTAVFYTYGIQGHRPVVLSATLSTGKSLPVEVISPYVSLLPKRLPHLVFHYQRSEVEARSIDMQRHQMAITPAKRELQIGDHADDTAVDGVPLDYDETLFGTKPDISYNLDEYRQFLTIREALLEYVTFVVKRKIDGATRLFVLREQEHYNTILPTLVLLDGMPVYDIERLLNYDARRLHHINIYESQYTFGRGVYNGVLSFVTRSGRLTNYPTEPNVQYLVYDFPE